MKNFSLLSILLVIVPGLVAAQNFYNTSGTTVSISANAKISVKDSLINEGKLINNGNMIVGGSWRNLGEYDAGSGKITFNGDADVPQIINHNNQSINRLEISGGGEKLILADLTVVESLVLTNGIIITQNNAGVRFSPAATISGGSDEAHIQATVYQTGSGTKLFPVGNGTAYLPVEISGLPADALIGIALNELPNAGTLKTDASLVDISDKRYWAVDVVSGSLANARITLPVEGDEGLDNLKNDQFGVAFASRISQNFSSLGRGGNSGSARVQSDRSPAAGFVTLALLAENLEIVVFNAISPQLQDGLNDFIRIDNILETDLVSIYNRWGDLVFEMKGYSNADPGKRFNGQSNVGGSKELPVGNYFYVIKRKAGKEISGYLSLRR